MAVESGHAVSVPGRLMQSVSAAGDVEMIPEGQGNLPDLNAFRIRPTAHEPDPYTSSASSSRRVTFEGLPAPAADAEVATRGACLDIHPFSKIRYPSFSHAEPLPGVLIAFPCEAFRPI